MMTRSLLKRSCIAGLLFIVSMLSVGTGEAVQINPKQMNDEPLEETLGDQKKQRDIAFSEIVSRLEKSEYDRNSSLAKQMANPKQMSDEQLVETLDDLRWGRIASMEIRRRLRESDYDRNSSLAQRLADTWKGTDETRLQRRRIKCFYALLSVRSQEVTDVLCRQLIEGGTRYERRMAALSLGRIEGKSEEVAAVLHSAVVEDEGVMGPGRSIARESIFALGGMGSTGAKTLMEIWGSEIERWDCEEPVVIAMGQTKDKRFIPALIEVLEGKQEMLRDNAAWALGEIADNTSLSALRKYEKDPNAKVREEVQEAIEKIEEKEKGIKKVK